jgi:dTDP-4-amino-4,6-dideoxygalactose transaminase
MSEIPALPFIDLKSQYERIKDKLDARFRKILSSAGFVMGPELRELEGALAEYVGVSECVSCANGTDALSLALMVHEVGPGDAVFCPSFTFIATAEVISLRGATPVFVDSDLATFNIDPEDLKRKIRALRKIGEFIPKGIVTVDLFGLPADYDKAEAIAKEYGLFVIEDAAQGFGGRIGERRAGSFGDMAGTSFFPAKPLGCYGDGGAVFTRDKNYAELLRSYRLHGQGREKYEHARVGMNSRLDSLQAAVLLEKLSIFPEELELRQKVAVGYFERLKGVSGLVLPSVKPGFLSSWAQYTVRLPKEAKGAARDKIIASLKAKGVPLMVYYPKPLHLQPAYLTGAGKRGDCPAAEKLSEEVLSLPMHPYLGEEDQDRIAKALAEEIGRL